MLRLSLVRAHRATAAFIIWGLRSDPNRNRMPARCDLVADPALREVGLGAGHVDAAEVDPHAAIRRGAPGCHLGARRRGTRIQAEARECACSEGGALGARRRWPGRLERLSW